MSTNFRPSPVAKRRTDRSAGASRAERTESVRRQGPFPQDPTTCQAELAVVGVVPAFRKAPY